MPAFRINRWLATAGLPLTAAACFVVADTPPPVGKGRIETPTKAVVANSAPAATPPPVGKYVFESPTKSVVANSTPAAPAATPAADNPTVEPGLVKWHKTSEDARAAAKKSGKPVLLFQMMGHLDKQFC